MPEHLLGKRLVHLSDLHIGPRVSDDYLLSVFKRVKKLTPDIVVYTGDFTSYYPGIYQHAGRMMEHLPRGQQATLGILGNHDYGPGWAHPEIAARIANLVEGRGIRILRNEVADVEGLQVVGLDDLWAHRFRPGEALPKVDPQRASIVLSHNPDTVDKPGWGDYKGWVLSGHTHGGQCKPPFLPPPLLPVENRNYTSGAFLLEGGRNMYISRGVGHLLQARFNVRPEVTVFTLARA
jgi:predicted MPP superfamily phosphohydrolase